MGVEDKYLKEGTKYSNNPEYARRFAEQLWKNWIKDIDNFAKTKGISSSEMRTMIAEEWYVLISNSPDVEIYFR